MYRCLFTCDVMQWTSTLHDTHTGARAQGTSMGLAEGGSCVVCMRVCAGLRLLACAIQCDGPAIR